MKQILIVLLLGIITINVRSQEINKIEPNSTDLSEFEFLKEIIGDKRIVCLGEEDHWYGEYFQLKNKLIQFLIKEMDFKIVVFEASGKNSIVTELGDLELSEQVNLTMNRFWKTKSVYELINFLREKQNVHQMGVDVISHDETDTNYISEIKKIIESIDIELFEEFTVVNKEIALAQDRFQAKNKSIKESQGVAYRQVLKRLINKVISSKEILLKSVTEKQFKYLVYSLNCSIQETYFLEQKGMSAHMKYRDKAMAENLTWIKKEYAPNEKIIVWAANVHIERNPSIENRFKKMNLKFMVELLPAEIQKEMLVFDLSPIRFIGKGKDDISSKVIFVDKEFLPVKEREKGIDGGFYFKNLTNFREFLFSK